MIDNDVNIVNSVQNLLIFDIQFYVTISILTNNDETKNDDGKQGFEAWRITSTAFFWRSIFGLVLSNVFISVFTGLQSFSVIEENISNVLSGEAQHVTSLCDLTWPQKYLLLRKNIWPHLTVVGGVVGGDEHGGRAHAVGAAAVEHRRHHQSRHTADTAFISRVTILTMHTTVYQLTSAAVLPFDCDWTCKSYAFDHLLHPGPAAALVPGKYVRLLLTPGLSTVWLTAARLQLDKVEWKVISWAVNEPSRSFTNVIS